MTYDASNKYEDAKQAPPAAVGTRLPANTSSFRLQPSAMSRFRRSLGFLSSFLYFCALWDALSDVLSGRGVLIVAHREAPRCLRIRKPASSANADGNCSAILDIHLISEETG